MKVYRLSLDIVTSPTVTAPELADLLGLPAAALAKEQGRRSILWRYEPSADQTDTLAEGIGQLASEVCPRRAARPGNGIRKISLDIDVRYDTVTCTVVLPLHCLVSLAKRITELSWVALTCSPSHEELAPPSHRGNPPGDPDLTEEEARKLYDEWKAAGRPRPRGARAPLVLDRSRTRTGRNKSNRSRRADSNKYLVSLHAITSASATASEVADVLGLPPASFSRQRTADGTVWTCEVEADRTVGLAERISFLASEAHPRRPFLPDGEVKRVSLDIAVLYDTDSPEVCSVNIPMAGLRSLMRKLPVHRVCVTCYPTREEEDADEEG